MSRWSEATRRKAAQSYGQWLAYLARMGLLAGMPEERATPEVVVRYVEETRTRCSVETTHMRLAELSCVLRAMAPGHDWSWLKRVVSRSRGQSRHGELKARAGVSARELYEWGLARMSNAEAAPLPETARAIRFREGLVVSLLIARPLRPRTFHDLEWDAISSGATAGFCSCSRQGT